LVFKNWLREMKHLYPSTPLTKKSSKRIKSETNNNDDVMQIKQRC
jgi:hypothetical protein